MQPISRKPTCVVEGAVLPPTVIPENRPLLIPSKFFPRLPCVNASSTDTRMRLAQLITQSQSPSDVWIQKLSDTKRDIDLHLTRLGDEAIFDAESTPELDLEHAQNANLNELRLKRLVKFWEQEHDGSLQMFQQRYGDLSALPRKSSSVPRPRVVVLGSGWGAHAVSKVTYWTEQTQLLPSEHGRSSFLSDSHLLGGAGY